MSKGLVSIIIPVFNRKALVKETLQSLLYQTYQNWEAIVVDDGSTDGSFELLKEFEKKDHRIKSYQRDRFPKGAQVCRNLGIDRAKGEFVVFLDSDDLLANYCLEKRVSFMEENPTVDFAVFTVITFEKEPGDLNILWNVFNEKDDLQRFLSSDSPWQTSSPIWRKNFLKQIRWDEDCISGQDWDFHIRALSLEPKYTKVDAVPDCFIRRDGNERISMNFFKLPQILNRHIRWQRNYKILKEKGIWKKSYNKGYACYYFVFCEHALLRGNSLNAWKFYYPVYRDGLLGLKYFIITSFYLVMLQKLRNHKFLRNIFKKKFLKYIPDFLKFENQYKTQEKIKLQGDKLNKLLLLNKNLIHFKALI